MADQDAIRDVIEAAYASDRWRDDPVVAEAVEAAIDLLDAGRIRVANPPEEPDWPGHPEPES